MHGRCTESVNFNVTALQFDHACVCDDGWTGKDCATGLFYDYFFLFTLQISVLKLRGLLFEFLSFDMSISIYCGFVHKKRVLR